MAVCNMRIFTSSLVGRKIARIERFHLSVGTDPKKMLVKFIGRAAECKQGKIFW